MKTVAAITTVTALTIMAVTLIAGADIPPPLPNWASIAYDGEVSVFNTFDGTGDPLNACRTEESPPGTTVDATITIEALHPFTQEPLPGLAAEDFWLETNEGGLVLCPGGGPADGPTDIDGSTSFSQPLRGGGHSNRAASEVVFVVYAGEIVHERGFDMLFNSADINGDLIVDLDDVILFCQMYGTHAYHYAIDFYFDGVINLNDIVYFAQNMNSLCN